MIRIIEIDIEKFIADLLNNGEAEANIPLILYDCRINGIDTLEKAEAAFNDYIQKGGKTL